MDPSNILGGFATGWGQSDRRVGLNRVGKMTPDMNPKCSSNPNLRTYRVVWANSKP